MTPLIVSWQAWGLWLISWLIAARWSARIANRPVFGSQTLYNLITFVGVALLFTRFDYDDRGLTGPVGWLMAGLVIAGFVFCWWARLHLGAMWSGTVTRKDNHHIVDSGPYGLVRHPIYTGLILSAFAQAALVPRPQSFLGAALIALGFCVKARLEEAFLRQELGPESYDAYRARVPMLIPWKLGAASR